MAANEGLETLLLEKTKYMDGTTAISGDMVCVPNNAKIAAAGLPDSGADAQAHDLVSL